MARSGRYLSAAAVVGAILAGSAQATSITWEFGGVVDTISDPHGLLHGGITPQSVFSGSYTFDSTMADSEPDDPKFGLYQSTSATGYVLVGSLSITAPNGAPHTVAVLNGLWDRLSFGSNGYQAGGFQILELGVSLVDTSATVFVNDALLSTAPELAFFDVARFHLVAGPSASETFDVLGTVTYLIPEPGALSLFVTAIALVSFPRKR